MSFSIKQRRKELNLTMLQVAEYVGVSEGTISRWESGNIANMRRDRIAKLSQILQVRPAVLMGYSDDSNLSDAKKALITVIEKMSDEEAEALLTIFRSKNQ